MTDFAEKIRLRGMAEEDIYFARRDKALIEELQNKRLEAEPADCHGAGTAAQAVAFEQEFEPLTRAQPHQPSRPLHAYRALIAQIKARCRQHHQRSAKTGEQPR